MSDKTILITGCSSGIGRATVKYFQNKGWNVIATMRTPEKEEELANLDNVLVAKLDVTDLESIQNAVKTGIEKFGKIDALVNNAGYGAWGPLEAFPRENVIRQFNTNVIGLLDVTRAVLPHFRENKSGTIVNITSVCGKIAFPFGALYCGTKFAVEGISEALNYELEKIGCKVKIVEPAAIATDFTGRSLDFQNDESMGEYQEMVEPWWKGMEASQSAFSEPVVAAESIYEAVTDGTSKLRYEVKDGAVELMALRKQSDDETISDFVKPVFGL
ncbi:SDR family oxidoreductase [Chloroflexota bacterium]